MINPSAPIRKVVIVGGGTAGWMAAAALARLVPAGLSIALVESEDIGTVGVGEATIPSLLDFLRMLDIDEDDFVRATGATFKLGIEFVDWRTLGTRYMHPFGTYGRDVGGVGFAHIWRRQSRFPGAGGAVGDLEDYCLSAVAARLGRFTRPSSNPASVLASLAYAFHFDAGLFAGYLRALAERSGVRRLEGRVTAVETAPDDGRITHVVLADGRRLDGELFVDCSGFRSLLLGDALGVPFVDWQHWLPNDRALAVPSAPVQSPPPFTRATAGRSGWRWRIPLQHRTGNGHVYASAFMEDETAQAELLAGLAEPAIGDVRQLRFTAGVRARLWERNCVAIGLSGGFLEPLESTSIHLIQTGVARLLGLFPDAGFAAADRDEYNRVMQREFAQVRDFIILHYKATERNDSPYWQHLRSMAVPDTLAARIALWHEKGRVSQNGGELFTSHSWTAVLHGQAQSPHAIDPLTAMLPADESGRFLAHLRDVIGKTALAMPVHADFIAQHCRAAMTRTA
jgi:tryptophan halogenase